MHLGATPFSIYNTSPVGQIEFLLGDAGNRVMVVETAFLERAREAIARTGIVEHLIVVDAAPSDAITLEELERAEPRPDFDFEATWRAVGGDDVLTLIYTSGTTGPPKGVELTHANELAECRGIDLVALPQPGRVTFALNGTSCNIRCNFGGARYAAMIPPARHTAIAPSRTPRAAKENLSVVGSAFMALYPNRDWWGRPAACW